MAYANITITTDTGLAFITGEFIQVINDSNNYINAQVVSYNPTNGQLVFTPLSYAGSGTFTSWKVIASGAFGTNGTSGADGFSTGSVYYFNPTVPSATPTYYTMDKNLVVGVGSTLTATGSGNQLIGSFETIPNNPNVTTIPSGNWNFEQYVSMSANGGAPSLFVNIYKRTTGGLETLIATNSTVPEVINNGTIKDLYLFSCPVPATNINATDTIVVKFYASVLGAKTMTLYFEDNNIAQVTTSLAPYNSGTAGTSGANGTQGTSGSAGTSGTSGSSGQSGTSGVSGTAGTSGSSGSTGTSGQTGSSGTSGANGVAGTSGTAGTSGATGAAGTGGTSGSSGSSGLTGANGTNGVSGTSGANGANGSSGTSGANGSSGTAGTSGINGSTGSSGSSGTNGSSGVNGTSGSSGTSGQIGPTGTAGTSGLTNGSSGTSGTSGVSGTSGSSGSSGSSGTSGSSGSSGLTNGTSGVNGGAGSSGTSGASPSISTNLQLNSLGVGTAATGTTGEIIATNNITAYYSDRRLKNILGNIDNALEKINQLNGVYYVQNELAASFGYDNQERQVGFIAQQVDAVMPEAIALAPFDRDENGKSKSGQNYITIQHEKLLPLIVEGMKELHILFKEHIEKK